MKKSPSLNEHQPIPTFVINLRHRADRKIHIKKEFEGKKEFNVEIVEPISHEKGNVSLWLTMQDLVKRNLEEDYIVICEDDHHFTNDYSEYYLINCIQDATSQRADLLCGGVSFFRDALQVSDTLFHAVSFTGTQFILIFKKFYQRILEAEFVETDSADLKMALLSDCIFFSFPFFSSQKEFGYSDVTNENNGTDRVEQLFSSAQEQAAIIGKVKSHYLKKLDQFEADDHYDDISIPTYIINLPDRVERRSHIIQQFSDKTEFQLNMVEACKHDKGNFGLWKSFCKVIELAIANDDDVIIICEDDHTFHEDYSRDRFLKTIIQAHHCGCDYLNAGTGQFNQAVPISANMYWTDHCLSTQFIVLYRKFFRKILEEPYSESMFPDMKLSQMTTNKLLAYPQVSYQTNFGYSDVTPLHNEQDGIVQAMFKRSKSRLDNFANVIKVHAVFK